jgi:nicotinamide-nucleotide amidase
MPNIIEALIAKKVTLSAIESFTGGGFSNFITSYPGASQVFKGSLIAYTKGAKVNLAKIDPELISRHGMISKEVTLAMALQAKRLFKSDIGVGFSGNAGPTATENKPVGLIYVAIVYKDLEIVEKIEFNLTRSEIREHSINYTIAKILDIIL